MSKSVLDIDKNLEDFGEDVAPMMLKQYLTQTFDVHMGTFKDALVTKDWRKVMFVVHTLEGSTGYINAERFVSICNKLQTFLKDFTTRIVYDSALPVDPGRPMYQITDNFGEKEQLEGIAMFSTFIQEAKFLKEALSKVTNTTANLQIFEDLKSISTQWQQQLKQPSRQPSQSQMKFSAHSMKMTSLKDVTRLDIDKIPSKLGSNLNHQVDQTNMQSDLDKSRPLVQSQHHIDPPVNAKCCSKCSLF